MVKKSLALFLCIMLAASTFTGCAPETSAPDVIKIGTVLPMTGDSATYGKTSKQGVDLAAEEQNAKGGLLGKKIEVISEDDGNTPSNAANALQKLISNDKVVAVVGSVASKCSIAMGPIATQNKVPMVAVASTNPKVTVEGGEYVFRACFIDPFQGTVLAKFATGTLKAKTAAVLYDVGNDYSKGLAEYFKDGFEKAGGEVIAYETYSTGDTDFNAQLTKIKPLNPDIILLPDYYGTAGLIAKQARNQGITSTFIGADGWDSIDLYKVGGEAIDGGYFSSLFSADDTSPEVVAFRKAYEEKYKETPDTDGCLGYDAAKIIFNAIERAGSTDGEKIKDALKATDAIFVSGRIKYDADRNPQKPAFILQVNKDKYKFIEKANP